MAFRSDLEIGRYFAGTKRLQLYTTIITLILSVVYVYAPELYPTTVRSIGMGLASMMARIGGVAAPYIILTAAKGEWIPLVI